MKAVGAFLDEENAFSFGTSSKFWPISDEVDLNNIGPIYENLSQLVPNCDTFSTNLPYFSQESSKSSPNSSIFFPNNPNLENQYFGNPNDFESVQCYPLFSNNAIEEIHREKKEDRTEGLKNKHHQPANAADPGKEELQLKRKNDLSETPKKKSRVSRYAQKGKKNVMYKKNQKISLNGSEEENSNIATNGSGCCSLKEDSIASSQELIREETSESKPISALISDGKTRAARGAATDPQSLYARKRRERINERVRILQSLVPNGTKVDISTMLEEAVQYVKCLQLQIKLLSSDDLWMYAPIAAYNGMDMGYPVNKISILTTYNGQKLLIRDVIARRCLPYEFIGPPGKGTTGDKFQGEQNDFTLMSLVRMRFVGHLRDVRRLVVAMSRAHLGLYVFLSPFSV
ncbi:hypothetical protein Vadar_023888 [Vaccinium darrowii]|nr:hypothetical protein Vadar_023888 [Vaccinium darrowii]